MTQQFPRFRTLSPAGYKTASQQKAPDGCLSTWAWGAPCSTLRHRWWRDLISPESGATVLSLGGDSSDADPMVELAYDEGGSGWWPLSTLVFEKV